MSAELPEPHHAASGRRDAATAVETPSSPSFDSVVDRSGAGATPPGRGKVLGWVVGLALAVVVGIGAYAVLGGGSDDAEAGGDDGGGAAVAGTSASVARGDATAATLSVEGSVGSVRLTADAPADQLVAADATGADAAAQAAEGDPVVLTLAGEGSTVQVAPDVEWSVVLGAQTDSVTADLVAAKVARVEVVTGVRSVELRLGEPAATSAVDLQVGLGSFVAYVPEGVGVEVVVEGGAGQVMIDDATENSVQAGTTLTSKDFDADAPHYTFTVPGGIGSMMIHRL